MITPQFTVSQDETFVYVEIKAPYLKASMIQFEVVGEMFVFSLPPYYLRLRLPGKLIEDDRMTSNYDIASGCVKCKVAKLEPGEEFQDLDMLSKLLATKKQQDQMTRKNKPIIEEIGGDDEESDSDKDHDDDIDWEVQQTLPDPENFTLSSRKYGFDNRYSEIIGLSTHNGNEINEVIDPEKDHLSEEQLREVTKSQFDPEHYLADLYDDETIQELIRFPVTVTSEMDATAKDRIMKLGTRKHMVENSKQIYLAMLQLIFSSCYDVRTNLNDITVESAWTIGKLSPCMCFLFNNYTTIMDVVIDCTCRSLTCPLYRNWQLTLQVWKDTIAILKNGRRACLSIIARLLEAFESDLHFAYRQIWIDDIAVWVQYASEQVISGLAHELQKIIEKLSKGDVFLGIEELEKTAREHMNSQQPSDSDDESDESDGKGNWCKYWKR